MADPDVGGGAVVLGGAVLVGLGGVERGVFKTGPGLAVEIVVVGRLVVAVELEELDELDVPGAAVVELDDPVVVAPLVELPGPVPVVSTDGSAPGGAEVKAEGERAESADGAVEDGSAPAPSQAASIAPAHNATMVARAVGARAGRRSGVSRTEPIPRGYGAVGESPRRG